MFPHYIIWIDWLEHHLLPCPSRTFLHIECPGCGLQRSVVAMLRGEWLQSWRLYPATFPLLLLLTISVVHIISPLKQGASLIKWMQILTGTVILISYLLKIYHHQIFA